MKQSKTFRNLHFEAPKGGIPRRVIVLVVSLGLFVITWWLVPPVALFWLLLMAIAVLTWAASFGWRPAVASIIALLHRLEEA